MQHWNRLIVLTLLMAGLVAWSNGHAADPYHEARLAMINEIRATARLTSLSLDMEALDPQVLQAMAAVTGRCQSATGRPFRNHISWH